MWRSSFLNICLYLKQPLNWAINSMYLKVFKRSFIDHYSRPISFKNFVFFFINVVLFKFKFILKSRAASAFNLFVKNIINQEFGLSRRITSYFDKISNMMIITIILRYPVSSVISFILSTHVSDRNIASCDLAFSLFLAADKLNCLSFPNVRYWFNCIETEIMTHD